MNNDITKHHNEMSSDDELKTVYANQHVSKSIGQPSDEYDTLRLDYSRASPGHPTQVATW
jgi:hypothetical protein